MKSTPDFTQLKQQLAGDLYVDRLYRTLYATDASAYREEPVAVAVPKTGEDILKIVQFAIINKVALLPRTAGTSLAGQVVGNGLIVDVSKHFKDIIEINEQEQWVRVQPGVVLDELNIALKKYGLFFAPETSTSNRCCIGGMIGNNSCGSHSLVYGSTREHLLEATCVLSDGSSVLFRRLSRREALHKSTEDSLEGRIYKKLINLITSEDNRKVIDENFPDKRLTRKNSGYAIDALRNDWEQTDSINICKLLCGSEGTLGFVTEAKLNIVPIPHPYTAVICMHCNSLDEAFLANLIALKHKPVAIELIDNNILELSKNNLAQNKNRFFLQGNPAAILVIELTEPDMDAVDKKADGIVADMREQGYGYHFPRVYGADIAKVWSLRKAGLGLLSTMPGDAKPVSLIEDTAVIPENLPSYMKDMTQMLDGYGLKCVYHAHISTGELHLRPILNLKEENDRVIFRNVAHDTALIVRKYKGSLSGEHGDGRLRGEFIPLLFGMEAYQLFVQIKETFDSDGLFNPHKITATEPMDTMFRYIPKDLEVETFFDFSAQKGWLSAVEQCNGAGDCRKAAVFGGTMCPTFRVTKDEKYSTRARANLMREFLIAPTGPENERPHTRYSSKKNSASKKGFLNTRFAPNNPKRFSQPEVLDVLSDCLSCKGCKSECPSNVDMARLKAEYLQHHYDETHIPLPIRLIADLSRIQKMGALFPAMYNRIISHPLTGGLIKRLLKFAPKRDLPKLYKYTLTNWCKVHLKQLNDQYSLSPTNSISSPKPLVYFFVDEFTDYLDVNVGICFIELLHRLGYRVEIPEHVESGRTELSTGMVRRAKRLASKNIERLSPIISSETPLVGIEPSSILTFRDEYIDLADEQKDQAQALSLNVLLYDEFIVREINAKRIKAEQFTDQECTIYLHGHCHQKSLASINPSKIMLSLPVNYQVNIIPSGCCGMAGAYGYYKSHYQMSMDIGEEILFPAIRATNEEELIAAPGTSCRQQIKDGTGRTALHPVEILYRALI
jgi:FAD/FMN-containing dehydrogenase/Fe-S oxidoreductase